MDRLSDMELQVKVNEYGEGEEKSYSIFLVAIGKCNRCRQNREEALLYLGELRKPSKFDKRKDEVIFEASPSLDVGESRKYGIDSALESIKENLQKFIGEAEDLD